MNNVDLLLKEFTQPHTDVILYGGECSGKTPMMIEIAKKLLEENDVLSLSNHSELRVMMNKKLNSQNLYKSTEGTVDVKSMKPYIEDVQYIIIDECPENLDEVMKNIPANKNILMTYKSENEKDIPENIKKYFNTFAQTKIINKETKEKGIVNINRYDDHL